MVSSWSTRPSVISWVSLIHISFCGILLNCFLCHTAFRGILLELCRCQSERREFRRLSPCVTPNPWCWWLFIIDLCIFVESFPNFYEWDMLNNGKAQIGEGNSVVWLCILCFSRRESWLLCMETWYVADIVWLYIIGLCIVVESFPNF